MISLLRYRTRSILALLAIGCLAGTAPASPVEPAKLRLSVAEWILPNDSNMGIQAQAERAVLVAFKKRYPHIEVVRFGGIRMQEMSLDVGPLMAIAGGVSPDVIYVNFRKSNSYIMQGFLRPLDEFIDSMPPEELEEIVLPSVKPVLYREGGSGEKHW